MPQSPPGSQATDAALVKIISSSALASIDDVIAVMQNLDTALPGNDGLKWFNLMYLKVTAAVRNSLAAGGWQNPAENQDLRWMG